MADDRLPISHPYPPSYRSQMSSSPGGPSRSPAASPLPPGAATNGYDYGQSFTTTPSTAAAPARSNYVPGSGPLRAPDHHVHPFEPLRSDTSLPKPAQGQDADYTDTVYPVGEYPEGWTRKDEEAEQEFLAQGMFDWQKMRSWRYWIRKEWWYYYLIGIVIAVLVILMALYHDQIVDWLTPAANWMKARLGYPDWYALCSCSSRPTLTTAILFVISFPPLFGHEIVAIICGVVWGLWIGFAIVAAGTLAGELGNFFAFKWFLRSHAEKLEKKSLNYGCLSHAIRNGGFWIIFAARISAIPSHFTTAVFSTCGISFTLFLIATILSLPKQLVTVYLGVILEQSGTGKRTTKDRIISDSVLGIGFLVTVGAAWYIYREMNKYRVIVWRQRRMEMANRGLAVDTDVFSHGRPKERDVEAAEEDVSSPMLAEHSRDQFRESYHTPYDIDYSRNDDMSVYGVAPNESDIGQRRLHAYRQSSQPTSGQLYDRQQYGGPQAYAPTSFPQAQPSGVQRMPSSVTAMSYPSGPQSQEAEFPVPSPARRG